MATDKDFYSDDVLNSFRAAWTKPQHCFNYLLLIQKKDGKLIAATLNTKTKALKSGELKIQQYGR